MTESTSVPSVSTVSAVGTFGEALRLLRRRARLTQRELGIAVGYSEAHIARLESNQRTPDPAVVRSQFVDALQMGGQPEVAAQLISLAEAARNGRGTASIEPAGPRTNLRVQMTSFVGRESELASVKSLLAATRLLTLTGPGGVGKTRLAVEASFQALPLFEDGVFIVPLASVRDEQHVPDAVVRALGSLEAQAPATVEMLREFLHDKHAMIVLDTCEHLIAACATLAVRLVQTCPRLSILATSREALNVPGEVTWQVPPMCCEEAMQLFVERARAIRPDFALSQQDEALLVQICERLDGLPLAIELAAARLRVLSLEQIAERLDDRFGLLTGNNRLAPLKGQTLRTMIDWSWDLLSAQERKLLRRLSIFAADWTLELAEAVCADGADSAEPPNAGDSLLQRGEVLDVLTQLINKSLVVVEEHATPPRYSLSNTIRQYAQEKLSEAGEFDQVYVRYLQYLPFTSQSAANEMGKSSHKPRRPSTSRKKSV